MSTMKSTSCSDKCHLTDLLHANMPTDMLTETGVAKLLTSWCLHTIDLVWRQSKNTQTTDVWSMNQGKVALLAQHWAPRWNETSFVLLAPQTVGKKETGTNRFKFSRWMKRNKHCPPGIGFNASNTLQMNSCAIGLLLCVIHEQYCSESFAQRAKTSREKNYCPNSCPN